MSKKEAKSVSMKQDRSLFARLLIVSKSRPVDIKMLLSYSLSPVPLSLSLLDGSLCKTNKAALVPLLEDGTEYLSSSELCNGALIVDGMALVRAVPISTLPSTFGDLATLISKRLSTMAYTYKAKRIDFVGDRYLEMSIKNVERARRSADGGQEIAIISRSQKIPKQWNKFLSVGKNKENLNFLCSEIAPPNNETTLYATRGDRCFHITLQSSESHNLVPHSSEVERLKCNHEEADTRMLLHAIDCHKDGFQQIIINSSDTDVLVISLFMAKKHNLPQLYLLTGVGKKKRITNVSAMVTQHEPFCSAVIGFHAFTGCDSVSSFSGKGKVTAMKKLNKSPSAIAFLASLGENFQTTENMLVQAEETVCLLYGTPTKCVDEARYNLFCTAASESGLPPTKDALQYHLKRANYQAGIWKRSDMAIADIPPPINHGWYLESTQLCIKWMDKPIAPPEILKTAYCRCMVSRCLLRCSCRTAGLSCTGLCKCKDCENVNENAENNQLRREDGSSDDSDSDLACE